MRRRSLATLLGAALALIALSGCTSARAGEQVTVSGSTTCLPIAEIAAEHFKDQASTSVLVSGLGSSAGIEAVGNGTADIATSSRELNADEQALGLTPIPIAHDGIAIIVNPDNPIGSITIDQLRGIYAGTITNWSDLGGEDEPIQLVNRDEASGTREAFKSLVMKGTDFDRRATVLPGTGQVRDVVARSAGAIGYISMGFVKSKFASTNVKALSVEGVVPTERTVSSRVYPISRDLYFFVKGKPSAAAKRYIDFVLSKRMDPMIREAGFIPMSASRGATQEGR